MNHIKSYQLWNWNHRYVELWVESRRYSESVFFSSKTNCNYSSLVLSSLISKKRKRRLIPRHYFFHMNCIWRHKNMILKFLLTSEFLSIFLPPKPTKIKTKRLSLFQRRLSLPFSPCGQKQIRREGQSEILESWNMHKNPTIPNNPCFRAEI